jgi:hypothetical protein
VKRIAALCALLSVIAAGLAAAAVPQTMSYQGLLEDAGGTVVPNGTYGVTFRIYDVPSGGSPLWSEGQSVEVRDGVFSAVLGTVTALMLEFDTTYWISIQVGATPELPRVRLTSAPYARRAAVADSVAGGAGGGGDITAVLAGAGLTGGATSGEAQLDVGAGEGIAVSADAVGIANGGVTYAKLADPLSLGSDQWNWTTTTGSLRIERTSGLYPAVEFVNSAGNNDQANVLSVMATNQTASSSGVSLFADTRKGRAALFSKNTDDNMYAVTISALDEGLYVSGDFVVASGFTKSGVVETSQGREAIFCVESPEVEIYASGTARLANGSAQVSFDRLFSEAITPAIPVKVTVTPVGAWSALYLESTSTAGFTVRSASGDAEVEFHWMACGRRTGCEARPAVTIPDPAEDQRIREQLSGAANR